MLTDLNKACFFFNHPSIFCCCSSLTGSRWQQTEVGDPVLPLPWTAPPAQQPCGGKLIQLLGGWLETKSQVR